MSFSVVSTNPDLMKIIRGFSGDFCFLYMGCLSRLHVREWKKSMPTKTLKHLVTESRSRISEVVVMCKRSEEHDGNLLITQCMRAAGRRGCKRGVVRVRLYSQRKKLRLCSSRHLNMMDAAARSGNISLLRYLYEREFVPISKMTMVEAVHAPNSVKVVRWLMDKKCLVTEEAEEEAAKIGNLPVLRVFKYRPFSPGGFGNRVMTLSGLSGCIDTVDFVRTEGGCALTPDVLCMAALKGHLALIKHVRWMGVDWDDRVCWMAAYNGHLDVVQWARSQHPPCPWDSWTLKVARQREHPNVVQYCEANNCPDPDL